MVWRITFPWLITLMLASCGGSGGGDDPAPQPLRPANPGCLAPVSPAPGNGQLELQAAFPRLPAIPRLTGLYQAPGDSASWYAISQNGLVYRFDNSSETDSLPVFLDLQQETWSEGFETGLLGLAFHPRYPSVPWVYLYYTPSSEASRLSRFNLTEPGNTLDKSSEKILLSIDQPAQNHNGGGLSFGPDGYLYLSLGDGGGANDQFGNGQNTATLLGSLLRLDIDVPGDAAPYQIPPDNPFADGSGGRPEIFAYGLRNPWRWSFDRLTGELWLGDVGQYSFEEIDRINAGGNYGWPIMEGNSCLVADPCDRQGLTLPVLDYSQNDTGGCSVTGGYVYRAEDNTALNGLYIFGDYCSGKLYGYDRTDPASFSELLDSTLMLSSFAEDHQGRLYALNLNGDAGMGIYRIELAPGAGDSLIPNKLSETGCFSNTASLSPAPGVIPYSVNNSLWSDGADKQRYFAIPDNTTIGFNEQGEFTFPERSVLIKHFYYQEEILETRLFMKHRNGWAGYSYRWNDAKTDAELLADGQVLPVDGNYSHIYPSRGQCMQCHTAAAGWSLGPETLQLNTPGQLAELQQRGYLERPVPANLLETSLSGLDDPEASLEQRARSYLHSNCSNCHRPGGPITGMDLRFSTALADAGICNTRPVYGDAGQTDARLLLPGDAGRSLISQRMANTGAQRMPPLGSVQVDERALEVINGWINSLADCE